MNEMAWLFLALLLLTLGSTCIAWLSRRRHKVPTGDTVQNDQLADARIKALQWRATAEEASAMADMYDRRVKRLSAPEQIPGVHRVASIIGGTQ